MVHMLYLVYLIYHRRSIGTWRQMSFFLVCNTCLCLKQDDEWISKLRAITQCHTVLVYTTTFCTWDQRQFWGEECTQRI